MKHHNKNNNNIQQPLQQQQQQEYHHHHHYSGLNSDTSIIAIIGAGISGLATTLQILIDQQQENVVTNNPTTTKIKQQSKKLCHAIYIFEKYSEYNNNNDNNYDHYNDTNSKTDFCNVHNTSSNGSNSNSSNGNSIGYGLTLTYQPNGILHHMGILDDICYIDTTTCPSRCHYLLHNDGTILGYYGNYFHNNNHNTNNNIKQGYGQRGNIRIPRHTLRSILLRRIYTIIKDNNNNNEYPIVKIFYHHQLHTMRTIQVQEHDGNIITMKHEENQQQQFSNDIHDSNNNNNNDINVSQTTTTTKIQLTFRRRCSSYGDEKSTAEQQQQLQQQLQQEQQQYVVDFVIGADGIRSTVLRQWYFNTTTTTNNNTNSNTNTNNNSENNNICTTTSSRCDPNKNYDIQQQQQEQLSSSTKVSKIAPPPILQSLKVRIILGITDDLSKLQQHSTSTTTNNSNINQQQQQEQYHDLLHERGFYTLSNGHRLFVMPYSGSTLHRSYEPNTPIRFMWQLSFVATDTDCCTTTNPTTDQNNDTMNHIKATKVELQNEALQRTKGWHEPVPTLIQSTSLQNIWGTMLCDIYNPMELGQYIIKKSKEYSNTVPCPPPVLIIGDAIHAMSPFKGQGANQCLKDAITVSKWLYSSLKTNNLYTSVQCCIREIVQRTSTIVMASRAAAQYWHSNKCIQQDHMDHPFAGLDDNNDNNNNNNTDMKQLKQQVLMALQQHNVNAGTTKHLDDTILQIIQQCRSSLQCPDTCTSTTITCSDEKDNNSLPKKNVFGSESCGSSILLDNDRLIDLVCDGHIGTLRKISWEYPNYLRTMQQIQFNINDILRRLSSHGNCVNGVVAPNSIIMQNDESNIRTSTILHVAVMAGHCYVVHWLITEAGCSNMINNIDSAGQSVLDMIDIANVYKTNNSKRDDATRMIELLRRLQKSYSNF